MRGRAALESLMPVEPLPVGLIPEPNTKGVVVLVVGVVGVVVGVVVVVVTVWLNQEKQQCILTSKPYLIVIRFKIIKKKKTNKQTNKQINHSYYQSTRNLSCKLKPLGKYEI